MSSEEKIISLVLATGNNSELGTNGKLPWGEPIREDMEFFKELTGGNRKIDVASDRSVVIMGRKTFESIGCKPLKNRLNIVLTKSDNKIEERNLIYANSVEEILTFINHKDFSKFYSKHKEVFVVGGESIYEQFFSYAKKVYFTRVNKIYPNATHYSIIPDKILYKDGPTIWKTEFMNQHTDTREGVITISCFTKSEKPKENNKNSLSALGAQIGNLLEEKNKAYGSAFDKAGEFLKLLYPTGISPEQYGDALALVRIFDKQMRIATSKDAFSEEPYKDIAGYGILGWKKGLK